MNSTERLDGRALIYIAIALLTWSSAYAAIAYALRSFSPGEVALARLAVGSLCFVVLLWMRRAALPRRADWARLAVLGVLGLTVYHLCLNTAETRIASGTAAILISLIPAVTAVLSAFWIGERISARSMLGLGVAMFGVVLVVLASGKEVRFEPMAALVLISVLASAVFFVGQKPLFARNDMIGVTTFGFLAGTLGAVPFGLGLPHALAVAPWSHIAALLWLGIAPTFLGYLTWNAALKRAPASQVTSFIYFSPPIAVLIGWVTLGEQPSWPILLGGVITVSGVVLANTRRRAPAAPAQMPSSTVEQSCEQA
ncbi:DMT family transporter [Dyella choica]|uniref:DMT family transporter n=1 Tax=Dyella choica TaxID=1927959 RepID=A0A3S0RZ38_9GAMM|nr:DMT family transporter [Dyella choica]RUL73631.1 DMT family transporter [Dyella choica]